MRKFYLLLLSFSVLFMGILYVSSLKPSSNQFYTIKQSYGYVYNENKRMEFDIYSKDNTLKIENELYNTYYLIDDELKIKLNNVEVNKQKIENEFIYKMSCDIIKPANKVLLIDEAILQIENSEHIIQLEIGTLSIYNNEIEFLPFDDIYASYSYINGALILTGINIKLSNDYNRISNFMINSVTYTNTGLIVFGKNFDNEIAIKTIIPEYNYNSISNSHRKVEHNTLFIPITYKDLIIVKGGYIIITLDGDDYLHPNTINIIKNEINNADALLAPCIIKYPDSATTRPINIPKGVYSIEQLYALCNIFPTAPMIVYRTSIINENHLQFNTSIKSGEVYDFTVSFFEHAHTIAVTNVGFYYYVMRNNSATHQPNYSADLSVLAIAQHFSSIPHKWSQTTSFLLTELKMITSFTYNKYIRNGLTDKDTINTLSNVFENQYFQVLLSSLIDKSIDFKHKLYIIYLQYMPHKLGYLLCAYVGKMNKNIKNLLHQKKSSNFAG